MQVTGVKEKQRETANHVHNKQQQRGLPHSRGTGGTGTGIGGGMGGNGGSAYPGGSSGRGGSGGAGAGSYGNAGGYGADNIINDLLNNSYHDNNNPSTSSPPGPFAPSHPSSAPGGLAPVLVPAPAPGLDLKRMLKRGPVFAGKAKLTFKDCMLAD